MEKLALSGVSNGLFEYDSYIELFCSSNEFCFQVEETVRKKVLATHKTLKEDYRKAAFIAGEAKRRYTGKPHQSLSVDEAVLKARDDASKARRETNIIREELRCMMLKAEADCKARDATAVAAEKRQAKRIAQVKEAADLHMKASEKKALDTKSRCCALELELVATKRELERSTETRSTQDNLQSLFAHAQQHIVTLEQELKTAHRNTLEANSRCQVLEESGALLTQKIKMQQLENDEHEAQVSQNAVAINHLEVAQTDSIDAVSALEHENAALVRSIYLLEGEIERERERLEASHRRYEASELALESYRGFRLIKRLPLQLLIRVLVLSGSPRAICLVEAANRTFMNFSCMNRVWHGYMVSRGLVASGYEKVIHGVVSDDQNSFPWKMVAKCFHNVTHGAVVFPSYDNLLMSACGVESFVAETENQYGQGSDIEYCICELEFDRRQMPFCHHGLWIQIPQSSSAAGLTVARDRLDAFGSSWLLVSLSSDSKAELSLGFCPIPPHKIRGEYFMKIAFLTPEGLVVNEPIKMTIDPVDDASENTVVVAPQLSVVCCLSDLSLITAAPILPGTVMTAVVAIAQLQT